MRYYKMENGDGKIIYGDCHDATPLPSNERWLTTTVDREEFEFHRWDYMLGARVESKDFMMTPAGEMLPPHYPGTVKRIHSQVVVQLDNEQGWLAYSPTHFNEAVEA